MDVPLDALGYQARQPHQEDVFTSSTDAQKELLADAWNGATAWQSLVGSGVSVLAARDPQGPVDCVLAIFAPA